MMYNVYTDAEKECQSEATKANNNIFECISIVWSELYEISEAK